MRPITYFCTGICIWCVSISCACLAQHLYAQKIFSGVIKGTVVDDSTNTPLPLANIFIANSTIGTVADIHGKYQIRTVPYGVHQIIASIVSHEPQIETIDMIDTAEQEVEFRLKPRDIQLSPVVIEGSEPTEWKRNLKIFTGEFFGSTPNATQCKLLNPEVLDFTVDKKTSEFTATVREPLLIENRALGYRLHYYLKYFKLKGKEVRFFGTNEFEQLPSDSSEEIKQWDINRQNAYYGSMRHFLSALFHKNSREEGFWVRRMTMELSLSTILQNKGGVDPDTLIADGGSIYEKKLSFPGKLRVIFGNVLFSNKMSFLELAQESITIYSNGEIAEPLGYLSSGYWSTQRAAEFLPSDYEP